MKTDHPRDRPVGALNGVSVLDLSRLLPGPMCSWYLRGLGATVTKVEQPGVGDYLRHFPPFGADGLSVWFAALNAGARSVALDLRRPPGREALLALLTETDVLIEGFRPGVMKRLGLDPVELRQRFPRLVIASISGFGQDGPHRERPGHDLGYCGLAGTLSTAARRDETGAPDVPGVQLADIAGGALTTAFGIAAALFRREVSGEGDWLDVSMTDAVLPFLVPALTQQATTGEVTPGDELLTGGSPSYRVYRCADGALLAFAPLEPQFQATAQAVLDDVAGESVPWTVEAISAVLATLTRDVWADKLGQACVEPVLELREGLTHPLHRHRGTIRGSGSATRVAPPLAGPRGFVGAPAPALGADTTAALEAVGFDSSRLSGAG